MTATLERPSADVLYPNGQQAICAFAECARCYYLGRIEWLPDGTVRVLHRRQYGNTMCVIQLPPFADLSLGGRALLLLR